MSDESVRDKAKAVAAAWWDEHYSGKRDPVWRWWESPEVAAYLGGLVCGLPCSGTADLAVQGIRAHCAGALPFARAVSVGCGSAYKEVALLRAGLVRHFTLYDISTAALASAQSRAEAAGLAQAVTLVQGDPLDVERGVFDLVYWDNSLHHMINTRDALAWSRARLKPGGRLVVNDYVGPDRFQWPDDMLARVNEVIAPFGVEPTERENPRLIAGADPSEAADSAATHAALFAEFPNAAWTPMGGAIYHVGLTGKIMPLPGLIVARLLRIDAKLNEAGMYVYAWASAVKE